MISLPLPAPRIAAAMVFVTILLGGLAGCTTTATTAATGSAGGTSYATLFLAEDGSVITRESTIAKARDAEAKAYWNGDRVTGSPSVVINLTTQEASFYKGGKLVGATPISSGNQANPTPTGSFRITQKSKNHRSNLYGDYVDASGYPVVSNVDVYRDKKPAGTSFLGASMPYFLRFHNGVGMHAGFLPGFPDSHGCVRMPEHMAEAFYAHSSVGTPVRVVR